MKRSIHTLIHDDLKRMLIVTVSVSAVLLFAYSVFSFKQTETDAARFVMNHVQRLAQAGINAQDVGDIDLEIARFAQTWKETQDLDLRIDIFLNDRQISHAGQLLPFSHLSTFTEKEISLASGDKLRVKIQFDLTGFILYGLILLLIFEGAIAALFYILSRAMQNSIRSVTHPLEAKIAWLKEIASDLPQSARNTGSFEPVKIAEIDDLGDSIGSLTKQIVGFEDKLAKVNFDQGRLKMAEQVAHNIKGVVATLQLKMNSIPVASEVERTSLMECITSLSNISRDLLNAKKVKQGENPRVLSAQPINLLRTLNSAISLKRGQYASDPRGIVIAMSNEEQALGCSIKIGETELQNALSNLIDNSVEAFDQRGGRIDIEAMNAGDSVKIIVKDNGCGIPAANLSLLMNEGVSFKPNGNGIGLFYAKEVIEAAGGEMAISSMGYGTTVVLRIPLAETSEVPAPMIRFQKNATLICVDDDALIHMVWKKRLAPFLGSLTSIIHLSSVAEFEDWLAEMGHGEFGSRLYLFDFDLKNHKNGLDLISENGLALESILVSGMTKNPEVKERAAKMGLRCLSKDLLDVVPIVIDEPPQAMNG